MAGRARDYNCDLRRALFAGALASLCASCGTVSDPVGFAIVTQDRFDYNDCTTILSMRGGLIAREKELATLVNKADASPGGFLVSYGAYRSELASVRGQLAAANRAAQKNGCDAPKKP